MTNMISPRPPEDDQGGSESPKDSKLAFQILPILCIMAVFVFVVTTCSSIG